MELKVVYFWPLTGRASVAAEVAVAVVLRGAWWAVTDW